MTQLRLVQTYIDTIYVMSDEAMDVYFKNVKSINLSLHSP